MTARKSLRAPVKGKARDIRIARLNDVFADLRERLADDVGHTGDGLADGPDVACGSGQRRERHSKGCGSHSAVD
jgi:hypothetical protein